MQALFAELEQRQAAGRGKQGVLCDVQLQVADRGDRLALQELRGESLQAGITIRIQPAQPRQAGAGVAPQVGIYRRDGPATAQQSEQGVRRAGVG